MSKCNASLILPPGPNVRGDIQQLEIDKLVSFTNHPFHVNMDQDMVELMESISSIGIIEPIIVRLMSKTIFKFSLVIAASRPVKHLASPQSQHLYAGLRQRMQLFSWSNRT